MTWSPQAGEYKKTATAFFLKADWARLRELLTEQAHTIEAEADPSAKLAALTTALQKAGEVAVPMKVELKCGAPCETKELREVIRFRTK